MSAIPRRARPRVNTAELWNMLGHDAKAFQDLMAYRANHPDRNAYGNYVNKQL